MRLGHSLEAHDRLSSTMDLAERRAKAGAPEGLVILAAEQSQGRGQRGRSWSSPPGSGLYFSVILRPRLAPEMLSKLTLAAGVAVHAVLSPKLRPALGLKWPNDLLVAEAGPHRGKKLAGLLMEASLSSDRVEHAILGIGINLNDAAYPPALKAHAISLEALEIAPIDPKALLQALLSAFEAQLFRLEAGDLGGLVADWMDRAFGLGEPVELSQGPKRHVGRFLGLNAEAELTIEGLAPTVYGDLRFLSLKPAPRIEQKRKEGIDSGSEKD